jgi:hypothetical protein
MTQVVWRGTAARVLDGEEAEALAREAVAIAERTDLLWQHGDAMLDLAEVLRRSGRADEADRAERSGLALHDRKGIAVSRRQGGT